MSTLRAVVASAVLAVVVTGTASPALGHAELVASDPDPCATVAVPSLVSLQFSEEVAIDESILTLAADDGTVSVPGVLDLGDLDRTTVLFESEPDLAAGTYRVEWEVVSATDTDTVSGRFGFAIDQEPAADCELAVAEVGGSEPAAPVALIVGLVVVSVATLGALGWFLKDRLPVSS